ncbi:hypothetical protein I545_6075 [Mycobacterium kansasii 662]|uniref:Uncharacterized protein n=2 Tax=Mycobacterium kansasii TaxID=1768 RepID=A0A1V3X560_MYCKA|nr:hypothetical protein I547_5817 [Mycobacterium kansasii 824]EUA09146.1 hypothetical protein I545_6075 [Mycobacterium kansasii 662]OOK64406.1 hypothetical protein BZL29_8213 [Mycobacterium kansasii]OOK74275.1 hypothetical protein BZL30_4649 [Mycobacterium kansasii]
MCCHPIRTSPAAVRSALRALLSGSGEYLRAKESPVGDDS